MDTKKYYAGFWLRAAANIIDTVIMLGVSGMINVAMGMKFFETAPAGQVTSKAIFAVIFSFVASMLYFSIFQALLNGTFGKKVMGLILVDSKRYSQISLGQAVGRYGMMSVSFICLGLGIFWVGLSPRKQGWHDKVAGTVVVKKKFLNELKLEAGVFPVKKAVPQVAKAA